MDSPRKRKGAVDERSVDQKRRNPGDLDFADDYLEVEQSEFSNDDEINLITATGRIIPVTVKGSDTIDKIKLKIQAMEHVPFNQQELFFKQKVPENTNGLANLPIKKESNFTCMSESRVLINIFIKNLEGRLVYSLEIKPSDTICNLKAKSCGFGRVLIFNRVVLEDNGTLADLNIVDGSTLTCIDISKRKMDIFVKNTFTGKIISLSVTPVGYFGP